jgi:hypothetical protein
MIAQVLAAGKTVLFVSEKMAALDVVYSRLRAIGLGEFCLELHSAKTRKEEVLEQLRAALNASQQADPEVWRREAVKLKAPRPPEPLCVQPPPPLSERTDALSGNRPGR